MSVEDYIASGILENYLLGDLSDEKKSEVEAMAAKHPQIRQELQAIESTILSIADKTAIDPPASIKANLMKNLGAEPGLTMSPQPEGPASIKSTRRGGAGILAAASITIALITSVAAVVFWSKWQDAENRVNNLLSQNQELAENYNSASHELQQSQNELEIVLNKDYVKVVLNPVQPSQSLASVYWNAQQHNVYLNISFLPEPPSDKQYQLWALVDGQPLDAGIFNLPLQAGALLEMKSMEAADAFAITLEPLGGSTAPTLEDLQVIGNV